MIVDTCEFAALTDRVAENERQLAALRRGLTWAYQAAYRPVPADLSPVRAVDTSPGRHRATSGQRSRRAVKDRPFRVIDGGAS